jgi:hypothetical protein
VLTEQFEENKQRLYILKFAPVLYLLIFSVNLIIIDQVLSSPTAPSLLTSTSASVLSSRSTQVISKKQGRQQLKYPLPRAKGKKVAGGVANYNNHINCLIDVLIKCLKVALL